MRAPIYHVPERVLVSLPKLMLGHVLLLLRRPRAYCKSLRLAALEASAWPERDGNETVFQAGFLAGWVLRNGLIHHYHAHFCHGPATGASPQVDDGVDFQLHGACS